MKSTLVMADVGDVGLLRLKKARRDLRNREMVYGNVNVIGYHLDSDCIVEGMGFTDEQWTASNFEAAISWPEPGSLKALQIVEERRGRAVSLVTVYTFYYMVVMGIKPEPRQYPQYGDFILPSSYEESEAAIKMYRRHPSNFNLCVELGGRLYEQLEEGVEILD